MMSALVRPVGGLACGTLSILTISSRPSEETGSPVNGEVAGPVPGPEWPGPDCPPQCPASATNPATRITSATTELPATSSVLRLICTGHPPRPGGYHRRPTARRAESQPRRGQRALALMPRSERRRPINPTSAGRGDTVRQLLPLTIRVILTARCYPAVMFAQALLLI